MTSLPLQSAVRALTYFGLAINDNYVHYHAAGGTVETSKETHFLKRASRAKKSTGPRKTGK